MEDTDFMDRVRRERANVARAPHFLTKHDLCFNSYGWGERLEVWDFAGTRDNGVWFYPRTGHFKIIKTGETRHGIRNLLTYLKGEKYVERIDQSAG